MIVGGFLGLTLTGAWASVGGRGRERPLRERLACGAKACEVPPARPPGAGWTLALPEPSLL